MNSANKTPENQASFLYYEPAPYYEADHLDDLIFSGKFSLSLSKTLKTYFLECTHQEELLLSRQLQTHLTLTNDEEEKPTSNSTNTSSPNITTEVNMAELRAQVTALVGQLERILGQVQQQPEKGGSSNHANKVG